MLAPSSFPRVATQLRFSKWCPPRGQWRTGNHLINPACLTRLCGFYSFIYVFMFSCAGPSSLCGLFFSRGERGCSNGGWSVSGGARAFPGSGRSLEPARGSGWCPCCLWDPPRPGTEHASPALAGGLCRRATREALSDLCLREMNFITFRPL